MAYERYLKDKIKRLEELIKYSEDELKVAQNSLHQGESISNEIIKLNKQIVNLKPLDPERDLISKNIQLLAEDQANIYWNTFSLSERLEIRNKNLLIFKKFPKANQDKFAYEKLMIEYGIFINEIINEGKNIWWVDNDVLKRRKDSFLNLLKKEFENILSKRRKIILLPKEKLIELILFFEKEKFRKWYGDEEFQNLIQFKKLFNQIHDNYREDVFFA